MAVCLVSQVDVCIVGPEFDDEEANMKWALEQSKREHYQQQELMMDAARDSDEEKKAIEKAIRASQSSDGGGGGHCGEAACLQTNGKEEASIDVNKKTEECQSPGVELVPSPWLSARNKGSPAVSTPQKRKKRKNSSLPGLLVLTFSKLISFR